MGFSSVQLVASSLVFLVVSHVNVAHGQLVPGLCIFGDSISDVGNNDYLTTLIKADFLPYGRDFVTRSPTGRFCNGKLAIDFTAENLGFKSYPLPYLSPNAKGTNLLTGAKFASTGSGYYNLTSKLYGALSLSKQLNYYKKYQEDLGKPLPSLTFWRTAAQEVLSAYLCARFVTLHLVKNVYEVVERRVCEGRYFDAVQSIK